MFVQPVLRGEESSIGRFSWLYWLFMEGFRGRAPSLRWRRRSGRIEGLWYGMVWYRDGITGWELSRVVRGGASCCCGLWYSRGLI